MFFPVAGQLRKEVVVFAAIAVLGGFAATQVGGGRGAVVAAVVGTVVGSGIGALASHARCGNAFTVGGVEQHHAGGGAGRGALQRVTAAQFDGVGHPGTFGVAAGKVHHAEGHVGAEDEGFAIRWQMTFGGQGFLPQGLPDVGLVGQQFFKAKAALAAGGDVEGDLGRFNQHGAAATAGVVQGYRGAAVGAGLAGPTGGGDHGGSQGFFQWCVPFVLAPAAFEQGLARGVDVETEVFSGEVGEHAHVGAGGVDAGAGAAFIAQAVADGIFDAQGGKVQALERAVLGSDFNFEGLLRREPNFPRHVVRGGVHVLFITVGLVCHTHQHALRQTAVQVEFHGIAPATRQFHATARGVQLRARRAGDAFDFSGQKVFHASGAGQKQGQSVHYLGG